jgi:hypothetical protein
VFSVSAPIFTFITGSPFYEMTHDCLGKNKDSTAVKYPMPLPLSQISNSPTSIFMDEQTGASDIEAMTRKCVLT